MNPKIANAGLSSANVVVFSDTGSTTIPGVLLSFGPADSIGAARLATVWGGNLARPIRVTAGQFIWIGVHTVGEIYDFQGDATGGYAEGSATLPLAEGAAWSNLFTSASTSPIIWAEQSKVFGQDSWGLLSPPALASPGPITDDWTDVIAVGDPYKDIVLTDSPVSFIRNNNAAWRDEIAAEWVPPLNAPVQGAANLITSEEGNAVRFDGSNYLANANIFNFGAEATMEFWFKVPIPAQAAPFTWYFGEFNEIDTVIGWEDLGGGVRQFFWKTIHNTFGWAFDPTPGESYHVAFKLSNGGFEFDCVVNGNSLGGTFDFNGAAYTSSDAFWGMSPTEGLGCNAILDEMALYNYPVDNSRLLLHYQVGTGTAPPPSAPTTKNIAFGQVTETDTAQAFTKRKRKTLGLNTETDFARSITRKSLSRPFRVLGMNPALDSLIISGNEAAFKSNFDLCIGFSGTPQFALYKDWFPVYSYWNLFSDGGEPYQVLQLDAGGEALWLNFNMAGDGTFSRRSMDLRSSTYKNGLIQKFKDILDSGAAGIFVDDVNMDAEKMFVRLFGAAPTTDFKSGTYYTSPITGRVGWKALLADFITDVVAAVRVTHPNAKFIFNTQVFFLDASPGLHWTDLDAIKMMTASDWCAIESGYSDPALHSGAGVDVSTGTYSLRSLWLFVDALHALGKGAMIYSSGNTLERDTFEVSNYMLKRDFTNTTNPDGLVIHSSFDFANFPTLPSLYYKDLGERMSFRDGGSGTRVHGRFQRGIAAVVPGTASSGVVATQTDSETQLAMDSPGAWWKLNDTAAPADDAIGALNLAATGAPTFDGVSSVLFPSTTDLLTVSDNTGPTNLSGSAWTIEFEVTAPASWSLNFSAILSKGWSTVGGWHIYVHENNGRVNFYGNTEHDLSVDLINSETARLAFVFNGTDLIGYKNGVETGRVAYSNTSMGNSDPFMINGANQGGDPTGFRFGDVAVYTTAVPASRLLAHYRGLTAPQIVALGLTTETDSATAFTRRKRRAVNQVIETDTSQAFTKRKRKAFGIISETDTSQAMTRRKTRVIGLNSETDTSTAFSRRKAKTFLQVSEAASAMAFTRRKVRALGLNSEIDATMPMQTGGVKFRTVAQVLETDTAQQFTKRIFVKQIAEADSAQSMTRRKLRAFGLTSETDTSQAVTVSGIKIRAVAQVTETDTSQAFARRKIKSFGLTSEADTSQTIRAGHRRIWGQPSETSTSQTFARRKIRTFGLNSESDTSQAFTRRKIRTFGQATESEQPQSFQGKITYSMSFAIETDTSQSFAKRKFKSFGQASDTNTSTNFSRRVTRFMSLPTETDESRTIRPNVFVKFVTETDTPQAFRRVKRRNVNLVSETDTTFPLAKRKRKSFNFSTETDAAIAFAPAHRRIIGLPSESDSAFSQRPARGDEMGIASTIELARDITTIGVSLNLTPREFGQRIRGNDVRVKIRGGSRPGKMVGGSRGKIRYPGYEQP